MTSSRRPGLKQILRSSRDLVGEWAMARPDGPQLRHFQGVVKPLLGVNTPDGRYPIPLGEPGDSERFRLLSDGSEVHVRTCREIEREGTDNYRTWYGVERKIQVCVGDDRARFGREALLCGEVILADGCLPVYTLTARLGRIRWQLECFCARVAASPRNPFLFLRITSRSTKAPVTLRFDGVPLRLSNGVLLDPQERMVASVGGRVRKRGRNLTAADGPICLAVPLNPVALDSSEFIHGRGATAYGVDPNYTPRRLRSWAAGLADDAAFDAHRERTLSRWRGRLGQGAFPRTGEPIIDRAVRTVAINVHHLFEGDQLNYSLGNMYQRPYTWESGLPATALAYFGYPELCRRALEHLFLYHQTGLVFNSMAGNCIVAARYVRLTRDERFFRQYLPLFDEYLETMAAARMETDLGLLPLENYCGDIHTQVHNLRNNANAWWAMSEMADLKAEFGVRDASRWQKEAAAFRQAVLEAVERFAVRDGDSFFVPIGLRPESLRATERGAGDPTAAGAKLSDFGPYERCFESSMGSYYCLLVGSLLMSGVLSGTPWEDAVLRTIHERGILVAGLVRWRPDTDYTDKAFLHHMEVDDPYTYGYSEAAIRAGLPDRALVSLYGKLAIGCTPGTFMGGEGSSLAVAPGQPGRDMLLPPNAMGDGFFLNTLRHCLIMEKQAEPGGAYTRLDLLPAIPRTWLAPGARLDISEMPTFYGPVTLHLACSEDAIDLELVLPDRNPAGTMYLHLRQPDGVRLKDVSGASRARLDASRDLLDLSGCARGKTLTLRLSRASTAQDSSLKTGQTHLNSGIIRIYDYWRPNKSID